MFGRDCTVNTLMYKARVQVRKSGRGRIEHNLWALNMINIRDGNALIVQVDTWQRHPPPPPSSPSYGNDHHPCEQVRKAAVV